MPDGKKFNLSEFIWNFVSLRTTVAHTALAARTDTWRRVELSTTLFEKKRANSRGGGADSPGGDGAFNCNEGKSRMVQKKHSVSTLRNLKYDLLFRIMASIFHLDIIDFLLSYLMNAHNL